MAHHPLLAGVDTPVPVVEVVGPPLLLPHPPPVDRSVQPEQQMLSFSPIVFDSSLAIFIKKEPIANRAGQCDNFYIATRDNATMQQLARDNCLALKLCHLVATFVASAQLRVAYMYNNFYSIKFVSKQDYAYFRDAHSSNKLL